MTADGAHLSNHATQARRETRERDLEIREAAVALAEARIEAFRDANGHLVRATMAAEELEAAARETKRRQDEFLAMLAHELRNPLAPIKSAAALLERMEGIDSRLQTIHQVIRRQVDHMARLLDDLLDASRMLTGKVTLHRQPILVRTFVEQAVELCRPLIEAQHQHLSIKLPDVALYVEGDLTRLAQIVGNLLHNAAKYTPERGTIAVRVEFDETSIMLRVTDNGNGIAREALPTIFDLFVQEERSLDRSQGGLGIGLTVVRSMAEQHRGSVRVHSDGLGTGCEFTVVLPRLAHVAAPIQALMATANAASARILLIDDNVDIGSMLSMLLETSGYAVEVAMDGVMALQSFKQRPAHIVLCDIGLPGMTGYEIARRLRSIEAETDAPLLLIALTGYDGPDDHARALSAGFDHHLAKPVDFDKLLKIIECR